MNAIGTLPKGSFADKAAQVHGLKTGGKIIHYRSIDEVIGNLGRNTAVSTLPLYNNATSDVIEAIDKPYYENLSLLHMYRVPIEFYAYSKDGTLNHEVLYSHPQAIKQIKAVGWLGKHPHIKRIKDVDSTAEAVEICTKEKGIAIGAPEAALVYDIAIAEKGIAEHTRAGNRNFTDIYIVGPRSVCSNGYHGNDEDFLTIIAYAPKNDCSGSLREVISDIAELGLNKTKMYERPSPNKMKINGWAAALMFYIEIENINHHNSKFQRFLEKHHDVTVLGSYQATKL